MQHISKGPAENRSMTPLYIVEFASREIRERVLKEIENKHGGKIAEDNSNFVSIKRPKIAWQLKRNASLKKAVDLLKKDPCARGKDVSIECQIEGTNNRAVEIVNEIVFLQTRADAVDKLQKSFSDLFL